MTNSVIPKDTTHFKINALSYRTIKIEFAALKEVSRVDPCWGSIKDLADELWPERTATSKMVFPGKQEPEREFSHYFKEIVPGVSVDVYQVCDAFKMPAAVDHAVKKCLASGNRGYKDQRQDIEEAIKSLRRQLEIIDVWA